jgi:hypothetical protein
MKILHIKQPKCSQGVATYLVYRYLTAFTSLEDALVIKNPLMI